ncbi:MAG: ribosome recycling factor [Erysipelotrichaceae bacterium]|jgi:ribosome recycling factor|nr:ribosome recycling factor [Bacillota bacterium]MDY0118834.1 ribosome recycling factor [Bacilli bacterium]NLJ32370.1 ribosome recycling factor [Erysipelotrichaceae bacterium]HOF65337.1 ribosome recycling factor [Bacilli bacterium]HPK86066.1 ribosome recycling factor [Bacilli bacterium]
MSDINVLDAREKMEFVILNYEENLAILRTGRANASLLNKIECDYYGEKMPINQICAISVPEPRQLLVKPYDRNDLKSVLAAISASNIGINPINDGVSIRLIIPPLNEERRRDLVRDAKKYAEEAKIAVRNIRRDANNAIKNDSDNYTEDDVHRTQDEVQKLTDEFISKIDEIFKAKEEEIMTV